MPRTIPPEITGPRNKINQQEPLIISKDGLDLAYETDSPSDVISVWLTIYYFQKYHDKMPSLDELHKKLKMNKKLISQIRRSLIDHSGVEQDGGVDLSLLTQHACVRTRSLASCAYARAYACRSQESVDVIEKKKEDSPNKSSEEFDIFWKIYPRKISKADARKAWKSLIRQKELPPLADVLAALHLAMKTEWLGREIKYIPHAATWIRQQRWYDQFEGPSPTQTIDRGTERAAHPEDARLLRILRLADTRFVEISKGVEEIRQDWAARRNAMMSRAKSSPKYRSDIDTFTVSFSSADSWIEAYCEWLADQSWIDRPSPKMIHSAHTLYFKWINEVSRDFNFDT